MNTQNFSKKILSWYHTHKRNLPWRYNPDPYWIWVSEIIFQQTQINQGLPYFNKFIARFPDIETLAKADLDTVLGYWQGLGYYNRAHHLHQTALWLHFHNNNQLPRYYSELLKLNGIGTYTAAAIASIAFGEAIALIDGNVLRFFSRYFGINEAIDLTATKNKILSLAQYHLDPKHPGDYNQALMEMGALICKPKPLCPNCPVNDTCWANFNFAQSNIPFKSKKMIPTAESMHYVWVTYKNQFIAKRRDRSGIWRNLYELLTPDDLTTTDNKITLNLLFEVKHKLTHKVLTITFYSAMISGYDFNKLAAKYQLVDFDKYSELGFANPFQKFIQKTVEK